MPPFDIAARYQAASGDSRLIIQPTRILDQVKLTKELIDLGLGHAVPLLANLPGSMDAYPSTSAESMCL